MSESENQTPEKKPIQGIEIIAYNLGALVFYTILLKIGVGAQGIFLDALLIIAHVIFCVIKSSTSKRNFWLLSALLVLIVGLSTCTMLGTKL